MLQWDVVPFRAEAHISVQKWPTDEIIPVAQLFTSGNKGATPSSLAETPSAGQARTKLSTSEELSNGEYLPFRIDQR
jgi:hypothetical protein